MPIPVSSHHLTVLKRAGIVESRKSGRFVHDSLHPGIASSGVEAGIPQPAMDLGCCRLLLTESPTTE